jgi:hypothetical protein
VAGLGQARYRIQREFSPEGDNQVVGAQGLAAHDDLRSRGSIP